MSYQLYVDSLSQHGKDLLVEHAIDEPSLAIISLKDLERVGMRLGDLAKTKQFLGVAKRPRDDAHGRVAETATRASPNFTSVEEAFNVVSQCPKLRENTVDGLSTAVKRYNEDSIKEALVSGVKKLMGGFGHPVDKWFSPLMCVFSASGQSKTDTLNFIRKDAGIQALVLSEINKHIKSMEPRPVECKGVLRFLPRSTRAAPTMHCRSQMLNLQRPRRIIEVQTRDSAVRHVQSKQHLRWS